MLNLHFGLRKTPTALFRYPRRMMHRHFGMTNTATTCNRCWRKMPCCEGFWLNWISSSKRSLIQSNVASVHGRTAPISGSAQAFFRKSGNEKAERTTDGKWSAVGLADAVSKYAWSGKSFSE